MKTWDSKIGHLLASLPALKDKAQHCRAIAKMIKSRFKAIAGYEWNHNKRLKSQTTLLRPTSSALETERDYGLSKVGISLMIYSVS
jgi:hypothetical protein